MPNRSPTPTTKPAAILVTGASGGIGLATALRLCADGTKVFAGVRSVETVRMLRAAHGPALHPVILDVTRPDSCASAMQEVTEALAGRHLTALVNNAGIAVQGPLETLPLDELTAQFEVNLFGMARMVQAALPLLRKAALAGAQVTIVKAFRF